MTCKEQIINSIGDGEKSAYQISKELSYAYTTTHRYCRELFFEGKLKAKKEIDGHIVKVLYYVEK
jgi:hypothetical protein